MNAARTARLLIDGYSLLHRDPDLKPYLNRNLALARQLLVRKAERAADLFDRETTIVFDGRGGTGLAEGAGTDVAIVFAPPQFTADTVIERLVHADPAPERILVVTSDRLERQTVEAAGAESMSCGDFLDLVGSRAESFKRPRKRDGDKSATLGDYFPE